MRRERLGLYLIAVLACALPLALDVSVAPGKEDGFPGRAGKIAVHEVRLVGETNYHSVATLNPNGSGYRLLKPPGTAWSRPRWSPDGRRLVFSTGFFGEIPTSIRTVNANGRGLKTVFGLAMQNRTDLSVGSADWLPGGDRIAFLGLKGARAGIYTIKTDGTSMRKIIPLSDLPLERGGPTLGLLTASPDGHRFAFVRSGPGPAADIYTVRSNGSGLTRLARGCGEHGLSVDWSPNGRLLLASWADFAGSRCGPDSGIFILSPTGGTPRRIFTETYQDDPRPGETGVGYQTPQAAFSPDGRQVVFAVQRGDYSFSDTLMVMSASGGSARVIRQAPTYMGFASPAWQPLRR